MKHSLEILESRIAPAAAAPLPPEFDAAGNRNYVPASLGAPIELHAGQVLSTGGFQSGNYLLFLQKGNALIFTTDLNNNRQVDFNEITGIAAGNGMELIAFTDIHGDIVTNLREVTTVVPGASSLLTLSLSDSDSNSGNDDSRAGGDGRVLLPNSIGKIELRRIAVADVKDVTGADGQPDGIVDIRDANAFQGPTTVSIFGNIYAGTGFGKADNSGGLIVDTANVGNFGFEFHPTIGSIRTGTAVSGEFFSFGANAGNSSGITQIFNDDGSPYLDANGQPVFEQDNPKVSGTIVPFVPARGASGGNINGLHLISSGGTATTFNIDTLQAGNGGQGGGGGGNILNITVPLDDTGGYKIIAGNGGNGPNGGAGGSILNLSDSNSTTGAIVIQTGSGGQGITGAGGNGGNFTFGTFTPRGNTSIILGNGGDGFTVGGNGSSFLSGRLAQADAPSTLLGLAGAGTTHIADSSVHGDGSTYSDRLQIGQHTAIDFDGDGLGDYVLTTGGGTSTLTVFFGDAAGGFDSDKRIELSGARNANALSVGDVDNDGHPDIVVASSDSGSQQGIVTYLSQYDSNGNFVGFRSPRFSPLPQLSTGDPNTPNAIFASYNSPAQISSIDMGDFNGDGLVELAVVTTTYRSFVSTNGAVTKLGDPQQTLVIMQPDVQSDYLRKDGNGNAPAKYVTGQWYADFGTKGFRTTTQDISPLPKTPLLNLGNTAGANTAVIQVSPQNLNGPGYDMIFQGTVDRGASSNVVNVIDYSERRSGTDTFQPVISSTYSLGRYDSDRGDKVKSTRFDNVGFSLFDYNGDGLTDLISFNAEDFTVGVAGQQDGSGLQTSGNGADQSGEETVKNILAIRTADFAVGGFTLLSQGSDQDSTILSNYTFQNKAPANPAPAIPTEVKDASPLTEFSYKRAGEQLTDSAFDYHYLTANSPATAVPTATLLDGRPYLVSAFSADTYTEIGLGLITGSGGNSLLGRGGNGGNIGTGGITVGTTTEADTDGIKGSITLVMAGQLTLQAGDGGDGFTSGGTGGIVSGVATKYRGNDVGLGVIVVAGEGGRGVTGSGGNGGSILRNSFETSLAQDLDGLSVGGAGIFSVDLVAGNGGLGAFGGVGGSIVGNGTTRFDTYAGIVYAQAGEGGGGVRLGGAGGSVQNLRGTYGTTASATNDLVYIAGHGGDSVSGTGGAGGSILNSSPTANAQIDNSIILWAGNGGNGVTGGVGGSVSNFVARFASRGDEPIKPDYVGVLGGNGGDGTSGSGGRGGSVQNITAASSGSPTFKSLLGTNFAFYYNSIIAGNGGTSAGGSGGAGGSVVTIESSTDDSSFLIAAGGGGRGLFNGGAGGSVLGAVLGLSGNATSKGLVVAGEGGDATAFVLNNGRSALTGQLLDPSTNQVQNSFGGRVGIGGAGGSINGVQQGGNTGAHIDLIAGNGGSTLNYGTFFDLRTFAGAGGSISNVNIRGTIGSVNANSVAPIKSYNNIYANETMSSFVENVLRPTVDHPVTTFLDDSLGNVGAVVGAAGTNKSFISSPINRPQVPSTVISPVGVNGSLTNITASVIMSAVAGSVDSIASIQIARNINAGTSGYGADKGTPGAFEYYSTTGAIVEAPIIGGALLDGAIVAKRFLTATGAIANLPGSRDFIRG